jgi:hypothetical protein
MRRRAESRAERRERIRRMPDAERYSDENFAFALAWLRTKYRGGEEAVATLLEYYIRTYGEPLAIEHRKALWMKAMVRLLYGPPYGATYGQKLEPQEPRP